MWARMIFVLIDAKPVETIKGDLKEDLTNLEWSPNEVKK